MNNIQTLKKLIHIPSNTGDVKTCSLIITQSKELLHSSEVKSKILKIAGRSILIWGELDLSKTHWLINSHLDVVPGTDKQYAGVVKGDKLFGRGSADTKSGCAIMLANSKNWEDIARTKHITFMLVTDEEIGGESTKNILKMMPSLKGSIFLEPTGEKMIVQAKGIIQVKITAKGKSFHGSRPWDGNSALEILSNNISTFRSQHPTPSKETRNTTFNFSIINCGTAINQIPGQGTLWCDIRWNPSDDPMQIVSDMAKIFNNCTIEIIKLESTIDCPKGSRLRESFVKSLKTNSINPISGFDHGSSDARHCSAMSIPAIVFGPIGKNLHGDNEWVSTKSIAKVESVLNHWITNI